MLFIHTLVVNILTVVTKHSTRGSSAAQEEAFGCAPIDNTPQFHNHLLQTEKGQYI